MHMKYYLIKIKDLHMTISRGLDMQLIMVLMSGGNPFDMFSNIFSQSNGFENMFNMGSKNKF